MSFDGIVVNSLAKELKNTLVGAKIDKVYQPERDEIFLKIRTRSENLKLVISASASHPMLYIAEKYEKTNPKKAPVFCMTLRKYIQNGVIVDIKQVGFERIIKISVDSYDELKEKTTKDIYVEIMGKHSNIIVVSRKDNRILDSIKRIPLSVSRVRQILPGNEYELPPVQQKANPLEGIDVVIFDDPKEDIINKNDESAIMVNDVKDTKVEIENTQSNEEVFKVLYKRVLGISPLISKEICYRAGIEPKRRSSELSVEEKEKLIYELNMIFSDITKGVIYPNIIIDEKRDKLIEFSTVKLSQYKNFTVIPMKSVSSMIEDYYLNKEIKERIAQRASAIKKSISLKLDRTEHKIKKQLKEYEESEKADVYKVKGELITSYIYMIKQGMDKVVLNNFYDENKEVEISLKTNLTPSENAQKYFKKYNKLKNAKEELTKQLEINKEEKEYLENTLLAIENCENAKELKEIREELIREGYVKSGKIPKKSNKPETSFMKYISKNGNQIIVGKNNKQNDYLTLRLADNEDYWFHTKDIPGSHVVIKCAGKEVSADEIVEAATLAAFYSKAKMSANVPVDYTMKKNVKKPSGAKPGMVIYEKNKTVYVTPSDEAVTLIKKG